MAVELSPEVSEFIFETLYFRSESQSWRSRATACKNNHRLPRYPPTNSLPTKLR